MELRTTPDARAPAPSTPHGDAAPPRRQPKQTRLNRILLLLTLPLLYSLIGWSLAGERLVGERAQQIIEVAGIALTGVVGLLLTTTARSHNIQVERAYSAHLEELSQRLRSLAYRDSLTDLYNHRYFHEQLGHEVERANRYGRPVAVILLDLDHFKDVNDTYGHLMGDRLLALVGQIISNQVRSSDIAARYGGDEFAIILPDTTREAAEATARKLAKSISTGRMYAGSLSESLPLSTSYGVACCPEEARSVSELLQLADDRLYLSKDGRLLPESRAAAP